MPRKIYFLGGNLDGLERDRLFHGKFKPLIRDGLEADFEGLDHELVVNDRCTGAEFRRIWRDPDTYGIIWFGHGRPDGLPATSEAADGSRTINPLTLGKSSRNLHFLAILSCMSDKYRDEWAARMANREAPLKTFHGTITAHTGKLAGTLERWLGSRRLWRRSNTSTLSSLLKAAAKTLRRREGTGELLPDQRISADHFEPIRLFVPTVIIPRVGQGRGGAGGQPAGTQRQPVGPPKPPRGVEPPGGAPSPWHFQNRQGRWRIVPGPGAGAGAATGAGAGAGATGAGLGLRLTGAAERAAEIARQQRAARERREAAAREQRAAEERAARERQSRELERQRLEASRQQLARQRAQAGVRLAAQDPYRFWGQHQRGTTLGPHRVIQPGYYWLHQPGGGMTPVFTRPWATRPSYW